MHSLPRQLKLGGRINLNNFTMHMQRGTLQDRRHMHCLLHGMRIGIVQNRNVHCHCGHNMRQLRHMHRSSQLHVQCLHGHRQHRVLRLQHPRRILRQRVPRDQRLPEHPQRRLHVFPGVLEAQPLRGLCVQRRVLRAASGSYSCRDGLPVGVDVRHRQHLHYITEHALQAHISMLRNHHLSQNNRHHKHAQHLHSQPIHQRPPVHALHDMHRRHCANLRVHACVTDNMRKVPHGDHAVQHQLWGDCQHAHYLRLERPVLGVLGHSQCLPRHADHDTHGLPCVQPDLQEPWCHYVQR